MQDIDFLPVEYRQKHIRQRSQPQRFVVVAVFGALIGSAALSQYRYQQCTEAQLNAITPQYDAAIVQKSNLADQQANLQTSREVARLFTYLRHPWPRTQLLAELLAPLPDEVTLHQLQIMRETAPNRRIERRAREQQFSGQEQADAPPPAVRDLQRLREEFDNTTTIVRISGTTSNSVALHRYLGTLGHSRLFVEAELESTETIEGKATRTEEFQAKVTVRPGYGQPGGPAGPEEPEALAEDRVARAETATLDRENRAP